MGTKPSWRVAPMLLTTGADGVTANGTVRGTVVRHLVHGYFGHRPTTPYVRLRRYKRVECGHVWRQNIRDAAPRRTKISRTDFDWALCVLIIDRDTVSVIAAQLAVSWRTANSTVLAEVNGCCSTTRPASVTSQPMVSTHTYGNTPCAVIRMSPSSSTCPR